MAAERTWTRAGYGTIHDQEVNVSTNLLIDMFQALEPGLERSEAAA
ncbi:hypothetical protein [Streptosporangium subroseum]|nr:hypothetical protein OHB15_33685 [Streptosporangium subroseum]